MTYQVGGVTVQGDEPSNIIYAAFTPKVVDGGKARILAFRDARKFGGPVFLPPLLYERAKAEGHDMRAYVKQGLIPVGDLNMDHADPEDTRPSELA